MPSNYSFNIYERLKSRRTTLAVIGIGYVGRPVLESFAKHFNTIGYDIDSKLIDSLRGSIGKNAKLSASEESLDDASFFIVTVATPIDSRKLPDLTQLVEASRTVGRHLKRGDYVVFESTVYPGCTDTVCIPILEKTSGMIAGRISMDRLGPATRRIHSPTPKRLCRQPTTKPSTKSKRYTPLPYRPTYTPLRQSKWPKPQK